ncbi:hypothetical protein DFH06DRAFT_1135617 [Mycena polygramma]|nr:hypothetical protein DFH06DRAFT_1135617 [Mycena polygramma]
MSFLITLTIDEAPLRLALMTRLDGRESLWWFGGVDDAPDAVSATKFKFSEKKIRFALEGLSRVGVGACIAALNSLDKHHFEEAEGSGSRNHLAALVVKAVKHANSAVQNLFNVPAWTQYSRRRSYGRSATGLLSRSAVAQNGGVVIILSTTAYVTPSSSPIDSPMDLDTRGQCMDPDSRSGCQMVFIPCEGPLPGIRGLCYAPSAEIRAAVRPTSGPARRYCVVCVPYARSIRRDASYSHLPIDSLSKNGIQQSELKLVSGKSRMTKELEDGRVKDLLKLNIHEVY